jgi:RNA polymerase sigma-70 factor (ECF subfamily)
MMNETEALLKRARTGDAEAANTLFARHRRRLVRTAQSRLDGRLRGRLDASDVVQEAFQAATRRLENYLTTKPMPFFLWLRQLVIDEVHKAWHRHVGTQQRSVRQEVPYPDRSSLLLARQLPPASGSPSQQLSRREQAERVRRGLSRLSAPDRAALEMRHFEEYPYAEIGRALGISEDAARKQCVRALLRLSRTLRTMDSGAG